MVQQDNPGYAAGIGQRTRAQQLAWALKGAPIRKKDLRLNAMSGVAEGRKLRDRVTALMKSAKAHPDDAMVFIVFATPDLSGYKPAQMSTTNGPSDLALATEYVDKLPIGFLVFVQDRQDRQQSIFGHYRPLIVNDPRAIKLNEQALTTTTQWIENHLRKTGVISDPRGSKKR